MRTTPVTRFALAFALSGALLVGCGGSDDDAAPADPSAQEAGDASGSDAGSNDASGSDAGSNDASGGSFSTDGGIAEAIGGEGIDEALDSVGLEAKGDAILFATKAERFEMQGEVGHLYLGNDSSVPEGTECMIVGAVLSEGEQIVVHLPNGSEVTCP